MPTKTPVPASGPAQQLLSGQRSPRDDPNYGLKPHCPSLQVELAMPPTSDAAAMGLLLHQLQPHVRQKKPKKGA